MTDPGPVFAALADPTRRFIVEQLTRDGSTSVPTLTSTLPITRQAVAKHLGLLRAADLVGSERAGRETVYTLQPEALRDIAEWSTRVGREWDARLEKLGRAVSG